MKKLLLIITTLLLLLTVACDKKVEDNTPIVTRLFPIESLDALKEMYPNKTLVVSFYSSTNKDCIDQLPDFISVYEKYKDKNFMVVGLSTDLTEDDAIKFINDQRITFPTYLAPKSLQRMYKISKVPTTYVFGPDGRLKVIKDGKLNESYLKRTAGAN